MTSWLDPRTPSSFMDYSFYSKVQGALYRRSEKSQKILTTCEGGESLLFLFFVHLCLLLHGLRARSSPLNLASLECAIRDAVNLG